MPAPTPTAKSVNRTQIVDGRARKTYGYYRPLRDCEILLQDHQRGKPVNWEEFELGNQKQLAANAHAAARMARGSPAAAARALARRSSGLPPLRPSAERRLRRTLQHARFYRCDRGNTMHGVPRCMMFGGLRVDAASARAASFVPSSPWRSRRRNWRNGGRWSAKPNITAFLKLELQQARYEASLAERRYAACDPDNRLIAAQLEKNWETALRRVRDCPRRALTNGRDERSDAGMIPDLTGIAEDLEAAWKEHQRHHALPPAAGARGWSTRSSSISTSRSRRSF